MNQHDFDRLVAGPGRAHADLFRSLVRPCVRIALTDQAPAGTESRFGGALSLPRDFEWPRHDVGIYYPLGQIDFAEISNRPSALPEKGVLALLYADFDPTVDQNGEIFWRDEGYLKAWYFEDPSALVPTAAPHGKGPKGCRIILSGELDLPRHLELYEDPPFDYATLDRWLDTPDPSWQPTPDEASRSFLPTDYLLGYPSHYSLGYDPTPGPEWVSLLTIHSHDSLDWCWQDGNKLMVFIERAKLAARDFSALQCDAG